MKSEIKTCQNCKKDFIIEPDDFSFYEKIKVPPPTFCPECRMQRRFAFRNERVLHRNKCAKTGNNLISCFSSKAPFIIYERDFWWSDKWDPTDYGQDYDFSKPFFEQYKKLLIKTPHPNLFIGKSKDTSYGNYIGEFKNSYLVSASWKGENILYASRCNSSKDSIDMFCTVDCDFCYENINSLKCYETFFSQNTVSCISSYFLFDCKNCQNCFGCVNLRNKSYCIWNEQYTKKEYFKKLDKFDIGSYKKFKELEKKFENLKSGAIRKFANIIYSRNSSGDNIYHTMNSNFCFDSKNDIKDCKFLINAVDHLSDSYDSYGVGAKANLLYEGLDSGLNGSNQLFVISCWECLNIKYCLNCHGCNNLFGCVGLKKKNYCILNKQYTKEEYEELIPKIKQHMNDMPYVDKKGRVYKYGEFFPSEISLFGYNETIANNYFPLTRNDILDQGYYWCENDEPENIINHKSRDLPDHIQKTNDDILNFIIECEKCKKAFKIIEPEYNFLEKFNLPTPRKCFECRHQDRFSKVNPPKLWHRQCMCESKNHNHQARCPIEFETSYSPKRKEIVYCKDCYQKEVV